MAWVYSVILYLLLEFRTCQLQCLKGRLQDFSLNVTRQIDAKFGECIFIPYELTAKNSVGCNVKITWFKENPQTVVLLEIITIQTNVIKNVFTIDGLPHGEHQYGLQLENEFNKTYTFPMRIRISVSRPNQTPEVFFPDLTEGSSALLSCYAPVLCLPEFKVSWKQTKNNVTTSLNLRWFRRQDNVEFRPTADDHNTSITCVAEYPNKVFLEKTVTIDVKFAPKFLSSSQCDVKEELLTCVCISLGNPPAPITWPLTPLTDFSVSSYSTDLTVKSTVMFLAANYHSTTVNCISSNELGKGSIDIPIQNSTENGTSDTFNQHLGCTENAALPWITAVAIIFSLVLLTILIVCNYKWAKRAKEELSEEMDTYTSLNRAHVEQVYSVISPQNR